MTGRFVSAARGGRARPDQPRRSGRRPRRGRRRNRAADRRKAAEAIALGKALFHRQIEAPLEAAYAIAAEGMVENLAFASAKAGIDGFLKR